MIILGSTGGFPAQVACGGYFGFRLLVIVLTRVLEESWAVAILPFQITVEDDVPYGGGGVVSCHCQSLSTALKFESCWEFFNSTKTLDSVFDPLAFSRPTCSDKRLGDLA